MGKAADVATEVLRECAAGRARLISRYITSEYDRVLAPAGITANQLTMLSLISVLENCRPADLKSFLEMDASTISRNLDRMRDAGWIEKHRAADRRSVVLVVTEDGERMLNAALPLWRKAQAWSSDRLGDAGMAALHDVAVRINPLTG